MTHKLSDIDDLLEGINDPDVDSEVSIIPDKEQNKTDPDVGVDKNSRNGASVDTGPDCWKVFIALSEETGKENDKDMRLVCKLDRELADTLDECDINGLCRSDLVNNIVRAFLSSYLERMVKFKKERKSLFQNVDKA